MNKVRDGTFTFRCPSKSKLGRQKSITVAEWNVRTLLDNSKRPEHKTALIAKELQRYDIGIAALSERRFSSYGSLVDLGYTFYWSGKKENEIRMSGVGFAIRNDIAKALDQDPVPINDRLMSMRLPLKNNTYAHQCLCARYDK